MVTGEKKAFRIIFLRPYLHLHIFLFIWCLHTFFTVKYQILILKKEDFSNDILKAYDRLFLDVFRYL